MKCLLDLDGVLVDFMRAAHGFYDLPYDEDNYPYELGEWDVIPPDAGGLSVREFWDGLDEGFWEDCPWTAEGKEIVSRAEAVFGPDNVCLLTTPTLNSGCISGKMAWIRRELPQFKRRFLIGPAKEFCAHSNSVLIDDADHNVDAFRKAGGFTVQPPRPWNRRHTERGKDWLCELDHLPIIRS